MITVEMVKSSDSRCILMVQSAGFANRLRLEYESKRNLGELILRWEDSRRKVWQGLRIWI